MNDVKRNDPATDDAYMNGRGRENIYSLPRIDMLFSIVLFVLYIHPENDRWMLNMAYCEWILSTTHHALFVEFYARIDIKSSAFLFTEDCHIHVFKRIFLTYITDNYQFCWQIRSSFVKSSLTVA